MLDAPNRAARWLALTSGIADGLFGCYIQLADDLDKLVEQVDEIQAPGRYTLRIRGETAIPTTPRVADQLS